MVNARFSPCFVNATTDDPAPERKTPRAPAASAWSKMTFIWRYTP